MIEADLIGIFIFILGLVVGSFLNVCIVRMPIEKSIVTPGSHCVHCKKPIVWSDNIPVLSYLILGGRCRACRAKISPRYAVVELLTGLLFYIFYRRFGLSPVLLPYLVMLGGLIVSTFIDFEYRIIPDEISVGGMVVGLIFSLFIPSLHVHGVDPQAPWYWAHLKSLGYSLVGVLVGGGTIYAMGVLGDFLFKKESMGGGDVKLLAMVGAFIGWKFALLAFFMAPFFGGIYGVIEKIRIKESTIAYGPFLALSALICLFWGDQIIVLILRNYGIS